jgi:tetrahydromethanopterin S-methyltransferase subunit H
LKEKGYVDSDDDILEIEKLMTEKGIANHETAADYWRHMKQSAVPTPSGFPTPVMSKFDIKGYMKNPVGAARENAAAALAELRKNPKPIGL